MVNDEVNNKAINIEIKVDGGEKMYGAILRKGEEYYTYLHNIFFGINMVQKNYNWLITDIEVHPKTKEYNNLFSKRYMWLSGEGLTNIIEKENFQWIWGVLSGFDKNIDDYCGAKAPVLRTLAPPSAEDSSMSARAAPLSDSSIRNRQFNSYI